MRYSSITHSLREAKFPFSTEEASDAEERKPIDDADESILSALGKSASASVRQLSRLTHLPLTIVCRRLTQSLRFTARYLHSVPHALSDTQKAQRVTLPLQLLRMLETPDDRAWRDIGILYEPWFSLTTDYEFIWLP
jgi:hypothetical protein